MGLCIYNREKMGDSSRGAFARRFLEMAAVLSDLDFSRFELWMTMTLYFFIVASVLTGISFVCLLLRC